MTYQPWFTERLLKSISLGGLAVAIVIRTIQYNLAQHKVTQSSTFFFHATQQLEYVKDTDESFFFSLQGCLFSHQLAGDSGQHVQFTPGYSPVRVPEISDAL